MTTIIKKPNHAKKILVNTNISARCRARPFENSYRLCPGMKPVISAAGSGGYGDCTEAECTTHSSAAYPCRDGGTANTCI